MKKITLLLLMASCSILISGQIPQGFNYEAIARDESGNPIEDLSLPVTITIQSDSTGGTVFWEELHPDVKTNRYGVFTLIIGQGIRQASSTVDSFQDIDWSVSPKYIKTQVFYNSQLLYMGTSKFWTVPYSMTAGNIAGPVNKLEVFGTTDVVDEALFEVKNKTGQTVFAVYNDGVRIYVNDGDTKARKGGFAIGGFDKSKGTNQDLLVVTPDSIRAYIDTNTGKGKKGGFAIGGFDRSKAINEEYLRVTRDSTRIYLNDTGTKGRKGGFAIGGFDRSKANIQDFFTVSSDSIRMYINNNPLLKGKKGGFAIGGFDKSKGWTKDFMQVRPDSTNFFILKINPQLSSSFNIIGVNQNLSRRPVLFARTDTIAVSGIMSLQNNLFVKGNISVAGEINTSISDVDGNVYKTVIIGDQVWMAENLKTTRLNDGTAIAQVPDSASWSTLSTPAYCWYNNNAATYKDTYGALYNWYSVNTGKLCPTGWHIPDNTEWTVLTDYLGGESIAAGKLKETGTTHWTSPNTGATDEVRFTGLPGGARGGTSVYANVGNYGYFWTANAHAVDPSYAWGFVLPYNSAAVIRADYYYKKDGFSVRCLKN